MDGTLCLLLAVLGGQVGHGRRDVVGLVEERTGILAGGDSGHG